MAVSLRQTEFAQPPLVDAQIFDIAHFERQTFGDASLQREILGLFMVQLREAQKSLAVPMTSTAWRFLTHTLKGAAAAVGAVRMAETSAQWELSGTPKDAEARNAVLHIFNEELERFTAASSAYLT